MKNTRKAGPEKRPGKIRLWAVLFWLLVWQAAAMALSQRLLLVSPLEVILRLSDLVRTASFWRSILFSFSRISGGFLLSALSGILLAAFSARFPRFGDLLAPLMLAIKSIPVASFIILALIWLNSKNLSILIVFLMVLPILYTNTLEGIRNCDRSLLEMASLFRMGSWRMLRFIYLPEVLPYFHAAAVTALGISWKSGTAAEVIGVPDGSIGEALYEAKIYLETPALFAWTLVIVLMSFIFEKLILRLLDLLSFSLSS